MGTPSKRTILSRLVDVLCGLSAYVGARFIWANQDVFSNLPYELLTFAAIYLLLQAIVRGRRLAREGRK